MDEEEIIDKVIADLGFCGCGQPYWFVYYLYVYLERVDQGEKLDGHQCDWQYHDDLLAYAYLADKEEWTEHGTSIIWCWLTPDGNELLKKLRRIDWSECEKGE